MKMTGSWALGNCAQSQVGSSIARTYSVPTAQRQRSEPSLSPHEIWPVLTIWFDQRRHLRVLNVIRFVFVIDVFGRFTAIIRDIFRHV